jgi:hypothetical protein
MNSRSKLSSAGQPPEKEADWSYEDDYYGDKAKSIYLARKAFERKDQRFIEKEGSSARVNNKAKSIYQLAN